ncbi:hypothetical protein [Aeromicrobium sp.]|uniref:hypothetical protein n=1 Tax=Aeromicrobium sp. TaxID=1871063 RepID=UPI003C5EC216
MKKLTVLAIGMTGYVLGARAGRERYEQIKDQATRAWNNPTVQSAVDDVQAQAKQTGADVGRTVGTKVADVARDAQTKVTDRLGAADADPASDTYRPDDEAVASRSVPGEARIADAAHEGTS